MVIVLWVIYCRRSFALREAPSNFMHEFWLVHISCSFLYVLFLQICVLLFKHVLTLRDLILLIIELRLRHVCIEIDFRRHIFLEPWRLLLRKACNFWYLNLTEHTSLILTLSSFVERLRLHISLCINSFPWFYLWCDICLYFSYIFSRFFSNCWSSAYCISMFSLVITHCLGSWIPTNLWTSKWIEITDLHCLIDRVHALNSTQLLL